MKHFALGRLKTGEMNKTEKAYSDHLAERLHAGEIKQFLFEALKFRLADNTQYTPDFIVLRADDVLEVHEVKGSRAIFMDDAKVKLKCANEKFPFVFKVVFPRLKRDGGGWDIEEIGNEKHHNK